MKIYTKTGDQGQTSLWGGKRVNKDSLRVESYGTVDECNAVLGLAAASESDSDLIKFIYEIQNQLFVLGSDLASEKESAQIPRINQEHIEWLESYIDQLELRLPALTQFILPGGNVSSAYLHFARTICRRAERVVVSLQEQEQINPLTITYLNRLSDCLFVMARTANHSKGLTDVLWQNPLQKNKN